MLAIWESLSGLERVFAAFALAGGGLFILRLIMFFIAGDFHSGDAGDMDIAHDLPGGDVHGDVHHDADSGFKLLSFQGVTAFLMMFGLVGWALLRQTGASETAAVAGGAMAGVGTMWVIKKIFDFAASMQSSGTIHIESAVGSEGTVYLTIPAGGTGKVQVTVQERMRIYDSVARDGAEIKTGDRVRVVGVAAGSDLVVERIEAG